MIAPNVKHQGRSPRYLFFASLGALGVVFGDIGTSPLYAFRETFIAAEGLAVNRENVFGILSLMFWALVLVVSIKYLLFVMRADNDGEGGILALTNLASPSRGSASPGRRRLILVGLFGTALLYGDGVITPAISVLSAVEGLEVLAPGLKSYVVPVAIGIIVGLFVIQHRGTSAVGAVFGPVMIIWFSTIALLGVTEIVNHPSILTAVSPHHAVFFVAKQPTLAFFALGAIFLVVTGSEALYADMGHFGRRPIKLGWFGLVFPALILNYFGQGALLIANPGSVRNPFYSLAPSWALAPMILLATLATVIASQALISGAYSLTMQAVQLGYLPRLNIDHTSPREFGQIYIGSVNYLLMIACVGVVWGFGSSTNLASAYGVAVTTTMVITTALLFIVMRERWGWTPLLVWSITGIFLTIDVAFFAANIIKVPEGGWFPLVVAALVFTVFVTWKKGRAILTSKIKRAELPIERFIGSIVDHPQRRISGTAVYLFPEVGVTPPALLANLRHNEVLPATILLVSVQWASSARVPRAARATVHSLGEGFHQVVLRYGFFEQPDIPVGLKNIVARGFGFDASDAFYVLGKETVIPGEVGEMSAWRDHLFAVMQRNASNAARFFNLPSEKVIEVGVQVEI